MLAQSVLKLLQKPNAIEIEQKKNAHYLEEMPTNAISQELSQQKKYKVLNNYFFKNKDIYISKHNRFAPYPTHSHTFLEINYLLKGQAHQIVDGQLITLNQGDLLLLDVGAKHSIASLSENDLLINILFRNSNINIDFLKDLCRSSSVLYDFLINSSLKNSQQQDYLIFRTANNQKIAQVMDEIIEEYFLQRKFADTVIKAYLQILITNLVRDYHIFDDQPPSKTRSLMIEILAEIDKNYAEISLKKVAAEHSYNENYLSNLFKKEVGQSFSTVVLKKRLTQANILITTTTLPINQIISSVGITNYSFFYKKFFEQYGRLPLEQRKLHS